MVDFLLSVGVDVGLSYDQMQKDISDLVNQLNQNPQRVRVGLEIDHSAIESFRAEVANIHNSMGGLGGVTVSPVDTAGLNDAIDGVARMKQHTQGAISAVHTMSTELNSVDETLSRLSTDGASSIDSARNAMSAYKAEMSGATAEEELLVKGTEPYQTALNKINTLIRQVRANTQKWSAAKSGKSSEAYKEYAAQAQELENLEQQLTKNTKSTFNAEYSRIRSNVSGAETSIKAAGEATQTWGERVGKLSEKFGTWFSITRVIMAAYRVVREMVTAVIDLDTAMTELKKVTNETDATYEKFLDNATVRAKELGASLSDVVNATSDFARLGYGIEDAEKLADAAIVYKNVGDGIDDISTASESIIATMQAFSDEISPDDVMLVVDKFNEVGNNYAISSVGVGDALLRSAAAMNAANNSLDETIALATAANTIVQDPDKVGTAMKTVSMYLRAAKTEAEDAGESTEGMANSVSELRDEILALTGNKVDIQIDENTFKSTYQILQELSEVWGELTDISRANILEMVGGKRNSNVVSALLENFSVAEDALTTSAESAGSALAENEKVLDSIQGKINIMKASFETFAQNFIGGDLVKLVVEFGTTILDLLNGIALVINACGGLETILLAVTSALLITNSSLIVCRTRLNIVDAVDKITSFMSGLKTSIMNVAKAIPGAITAWKNYATGVVSANEAMQASVPVIGLVLVALTALSVGIYKLWDELTITAQEASEYVNQTAEALKSAESELEQAENNLDAVQKSISDLKSQGELSITDKADLENLEYENLKLQTQIQLLKERKEIAEQESKDAEKQRWKTANDVGFGRAYNEYGEMTNLQYALSIRSASSTDNGMSAYNAANKAIEKRAEKLKEISQLQEKINSGVATKNEKNRYDALLADVSELETSLSSFSTIFEECGEDGEQMMYKITLALMGTEERLAAFKEVLEGVFDGRDFTAKDILEEYDKNNTLKNYIDALIELGTINPNTDGIDGLSEVDLKPLIDDLKSVTTEDKEANKELEKTLELTKTISELKTAGSSIEKLSEAYKELAEDGDVSFSTLADIQEEFANIDGIEDYINALAKAKKNTTETSKILSELTKEAVRAKIGAENLASANIEVVASMLKEAGVANSLEVAEQMVAEASARAAIQSENLADSSKITAKWIENLATASNLTTEEIYELIIAEIEFNKQGLSTQEQIKALTDLAVAAGIARSELQSVYSTDFIGPLPEGSTTTGVDEYAAAIREKIGAATSESIDFTKKYAKEARKTGEDLYDWEKKKIQEQTALKEAQLKNKLETGKIDEKEYQKQLEEMYSGVRKEIEANSNLYGANEQEQLDVVNEYLSKEKSAHIAAYEAEHKELEHKLAMNYISEEQYLIEVQKLYNKYYAGNEMYKNEALEVEEELYDKRVELVEKWADAAVEAIEAMTDATEEMINAIQQLIQDAVDTNEENFNLEKSNLDHQLAMNYISEEDYYNSLEKLYKKYFKDKTLYTEQYWENQEEIYQYEQDMLENSASAVEDTHAKVVDMIKQELEDAIDAIEETKDKYLDLIEIRRKALEDFKDEEDYEKERSDKLASVTELQRQLNALSYDTSAAGVRKYKEVYAQLKEAQEELANFEREHAYDQMNKQLDNEEELIESGAEANTKQYEDLLDNNEYLVQEAWDRMNGMNNELYAQLIEYNKKYSTSVKDDITGSWETATKALQEYNNAASALGGYNAIIGQIGQPGMTSDENMKFEQTTQGKQIYNWLKVALEFGGSMLSIGASLMGSFMSIGGGLIGGLPGGLLSSGAGLVTGFAGLGTGILGILGSFASGTNYVPKTGWYQTDELGDELKLIKDKDGNQYRLLTEGSKVIDGSSTERLMRLANNPKLFNMLLSGGLISPMSGGIDNVVKNIPSVNNQSAINNITFQIQSTDPKGVAAEIEKMLPKIAKYTIGNIVNGSTNLGVKQKVQHLY